MAMVMAPPRKLMSWTERMPTVGLTGCLADERDAWETLRLEVHERLLVAAASYDVHQRPGNPSVRDALVAAKAAWEAFRKAQCDYEYAEYADGTMRGPVGVGCALRLKTTICRNIVFLFQSPHLRFHPSLTDSRACGHARYCHGAREDDDARREERDGVGEVGPDGGRRHAERDREL